MARKRYSFEPQRGLLLQMIRLFARSRDLTGKRKYDSSDLQKDRGS